MANPLLKQLQSSDKKGLFNKTQTAITYGTGFAPFDFRNGYMVEVHDDDDNLVKSYPSTGIVGGSFNTVIGKSGVAKTTWVVQAAANIVKPYAAGFVQHFDLEQALTYTRIRNITGFSQMQMRDKYILKQEKVTIEDMFEAIQKIAQAKEEFREDFSYDTGLLNEFNEPIRALAPTVIVLDSIPTISSKDASSEMEGGTYANRVAKAIAQFYKRLTPVIKEANIIIFAINHINTKIEINPMMKTQPQVLYLKMDESLPGGNAPIYYAHNLIKFVSAGKYTEEKHGFDGFKVRAELIKSRTNKAGQFCHMAYNQSYGFDPAYTMYEFLHENGMIDGRNPYQFVSGFKDDKFSSKKFREHFIDSEPLRFAVMDKSLPILMSQLSATDKSKQVTHADILDRLDILEDNPEVEMPEPA